MNVKTILFTLFIFLIIFNSCKKQDPGNPGPNEVWFVYKAYNPAQLAIPAGTTVTFTNKDNDSHTATSSNGVFDSGTVKSGKTYSHTFNDKGTFYFYCNYHSNSSAEQGVIVVQ